MDSLTPLLLVLLVVIIVAMIRDKTDIKNNPVSKDVCPLHKWEWVKQPGMDIEYILCQICNKTPAQVSESIKS